MEVSKIIAEAQRKQLEKPTRAVVNSESAFVAQRLRDEGHVDVSKKYWSWVCGGKSPDVFGEEVYELEMKLKEIDAGVSMPSWGTYGT